MILDFHRPFFSLTLFTVNNIRQNTKANVKLLFFNIGFYGISYCIIVCVLCCCVCVFLLSYMYLYKGPSRDKNCQLAQAINAVVCVIGPCYVPVKMKTV